MRHLADLIQKKERLILMIDFLNELASGTPEDQSKLKFDLLQELEGLRARLELVEKAIAVEHKKPAKGHGLLPKY